MGSIKKDMFDAISRDISTLIPKDSPLFYANVLNEYGVNETSFLDFGNWDDGSLESQHLLFEDDRFQKILMVMRLSLVTG